MRGYRFVVSAAVLAGVALAGPAHAEKMEMGTLLGAGLGGLLGSQFGKGDGKLVATGLGVFLGGALGNSAGTSLDRADSTYYGRSESISWDDDEPSYYRRGHGRGHWRHHPPVYERTVIVQRPVVYEPVVQEIAYNPEPSAPSGYCREYQHTVHIGNRVQESYGTACMQPDGSWKVVQ